MKKVEQLRGKLVRYADHIAEGTARFMKDYEKAGNGISSRISGEAAALIVEARCVIEAGIRNIAKGD